MMALLDRSSWTTTKAKPWTGRPNGVDDIPLIIQDRRFRRDGRFDYLSSMPDRMMGFRGDVILVNGTVAPHLILRRRRTRLRLLNGSNARIYNIGFSNGRPITQIGSDGSLLERAVSMRRIRLAPGAPRSLSRWTLSPRQC